MINRKLLITEALADTYPYAYKTLVNYLIEIRRMRNTIKINTEGNRVIREHLFDCYYIFNRKRRKIIQRLK